MMIEFVVVSIDRKQDQITGNGYFSLDLFIIAAAITGPDIPELNSRTVMLEH